MITEYILPLNDARATLATVGGKGASLARLAAAGLPVPDGFHITTAAYHDFVSANHLEPRLWQALEPVEASQPATLETAALAIQALFSQAPMPECIAGTIGQAYSALGGAGPSVAVRSSATAEDLPGLSFAGQQETFLNRAGTAAVLNAVQRCWASLWTARAIGYRAQHGIDQRSVSLAVVVQILIDAEAAGVLFTANPVTGKRDQVLITAAWGLGESIVAGQVTPDTLTLDKATGRVLQYETADKQVMTVRVAGGTQEQPVAQAQRHARVLTDRQAAVLAQLGNQIECLYSMPMDIEWTRAAGQFAIVQARPITALPEPPLEWPVPQPNVTLARGSFAEFVPEPVSPLFATLAVPIARDATLKLMNAMGVKGNDVYVFAVVNDYIYVGMKLTPAIAWQFLLATVRVSRTLKNAPERAALAREKYLSAACRWQTREPAALSPTELLAGAREIFSETANFYNVAQSATIPVALSSELSFGRFYAWLVKRKGDPDAATFLFGGDNHALRAEKSLFDLATWAQGQPGLADAVLRAPVGEIGRRLAGPADDTMWDEFRSRFAAHLAQYGSAIYDLDFARPLPADDPTPLLEALKVYLRGSANPYERQRAALERRERAAEAIAKRLDPLRRKWFLKLLKWAQATAPLREDSIADIGLGYPQLRKMLGELGQRLATQGAITQAQDIYWLQAQEADQLAAALEKGEALPDYASRVAARQAKWQAMRRISPPNTLPQTSWMARLFPGDGASGDVLKGFGASAGKVTARACVMFGPEDFGQMQPGDVIVAGITTPAWTPLFARASAIVTDIGGPLSHSSIVAREYGIPAVLGTGTATRRIRSGRLITVDGTAGLVTPSANGQ